MTSRFDFPLDVFASAEAGVEETSIVKRLCRCGVISQMFTLDSNRLIPFDAKPRQVLQNLGSVPSTAAVEVDVFDA